MQAWKGHSQDEYILALNFQRNDYFFYNIKEIMKVACVERIRNMFFFFFSRNCYW